MRLADPYWMSIVAKNDNLPILNPDHYVSYLQAVVDRQHRCRIDAVEVRCSRRLVPPPTPCAVCHAGCICVG